MVAMKTIIEIAEQGSIFHAALRDLDAGGSSAWVLSFDSLRVLFREITEQRLDLLGRLAVRGPTVVGELAEAMSMDPSVLRAETGRLAELGLLDVHEDGRVEVPYHSVEIRLPFQQAA